MPWMPRAGAPFAPPLHTTGSTRAGSPVGNMFANHLLFASDLCLFDLSVSVILQRLLKICCDYNCTTQNQPRNQFGTPWGEEFLIGPKFFELCPIILNKSPTHFSRGRNIFQGRPRPPWGLSGCGLNKIVFNCNKTVGELFPPKSQSTVC